MMIQENKDIKKNIDEQNKDEKDIRLQQTIIHEYKQQFKEGYKYAYVKQEHAIQLYRLAGSE